MKKKFTSILLLIAMLIFTFDSTLVHVYANKKQKRKFVRSQKNSISQRKKNIQKRK